MVYIYVNHGKGANVENDYSMLGVVWFKIRNGKGMKWDERMEWKWNVLLWTLVCFDVGMESLA